MTSSQPVSKQWSQNPEITNFAKFPKKTELPENFNLLAKRRFELMEK